MITDNDAARELVVKLNNEIADAERDCIERIDRLRARLDDDITCAYDNMRRETEPMRKQRDAVVNRLVNVEAFNIPSPMIRKP